MKRWYTELIHPPNLSHISRNWKIISASSGAVRLLSMFLMALYFRACNYSVLKILNDLCGMVGKFSLEETLIINCINTTLEK